MTRENSGIIKLIYLCLIILLIVAYLVITSLNFKQVSSQASAELKRLATITPSITEIPNGLNSLGNTSTSQPNSNVTSAESTSNITSNWAGYAAESGTFTSVTGSWIVPTVNESGDTSADAAWIGIGGISSDDLIQVGTQNIVTPDGQVQSSAFYELLPDTSQPLNEININPGDSISASINEVSSGQWTISLVDNTNGQSFNQNVEYNSSLSSAEWIEEDPSDGTSEIPFDNFGSINFSGALTTMNGKTENLNGSNAKAITMVNSDNQPLAESSGISNDGVSFSVTRTNASSSPAIAEYNQNPFSWRWRGSGIGREF